MSKPRFFLSYSLHRAGWATARLDHGQPVEMTVSYLHDSLLDLATSVLLVERGANEARVIFMDEPGEHQLLLKSDFQDGLRYELRWYDDWESWGFKESNQHRVLATGHVAVRRYKHQVANVLHEIYERYGPEEYQKLWGEHPFPTKQYRDILDQLDRSP
ncbi:hypothetical protein OT109_07645 [Phycisphaeraceae bacterium D3-23]